MSDRAPNPAPVDPAPSTRPTPAAPPPQVFGKYYLLDRLAVGGMAEIFRARTFGEGGFENQLVIKRILAHLSEDENFVRMFMDEARVTVLLQHANIVRIYDFGKIRANYFIAMEYVEGKDAKLLLRKVVEVGRRLPPEFAAYIALEAAKGLDYAHRKNSLEGVALDVVHRDVSPSNLLLAYDGVVKVADFGIVKASNVAETTDAGTLKGKFEYMSPEQAQGLPLDRRSDIFALGICLHELLTQRRLFKGETDVATLERIKRGDIPPPTSLNPAVPDRLEAICLKALRVDPTERYQDARELAADLLDFLYPVPPETIQQRLAAFMAEVFAEEIAREHQRLEETTRVAREMHHSADAVELDEDWEAEDATPSTNGSGARPRTGSGVRTRGTGSGARGAVESPPPASAPSSRIGTIIALGMVAVAGVSAAAWFAAREPEVREVEKIVEVEQEATVGVVKLTIAPRAGRVSVDGAPRGEGTSVVLSDLSPGPHVVRVDAEGLAPWQETLTVVAGETERVGVTLTAAAAPPREARPRDERERDATPTAPASASATATVQFRSTPSGARVVMDGDTLGITPFTWEGPAGQKRTFSFQLDGYQSANAVTTLPAGGGRTTVERALQARAAATGTINVNVVDGWAEIWVDGVKIKTSPLFNHTLSEGVHEVRARNTVKGLDEVKKVTVRAGGSTTLSFTSPSQ